jgi:hypothetical protein
MHRSFIFTLFITLVGTAYRPTLPSTFDGVTGTWKRTAMTMVDASGKTTDMLQMMTKSMHCIKDITYTFSGDGRLKSNVPDACGSLKKTIESMNSEAKWSISGRKITVTTTTKGFPPATCAISFQGNTMTWVFIYADNPKTPNPTKAQKITTVYQRI